MFAPTQHLDPLRVVRGTRDDSYDCPDLATLDQHIESLRRRIGRLGRATAADTCRADIDRLLDRRAWLTLPVLARPPVLSTGATRSGPVLGEWSG
jgi:hypothetical protein